MRKMIFYFFKNPPRNTGSMNRDKFRTHINANSWEVDGFKLISINQTNTNKHLIFLPGGAYILEATDFHRKFMERLAGEYGLGITFIDYPKAPEHTFQTTINVITNAYRKIVEEYPGNDFYILGDSAGGGLGLVLLQILRDQEVTPYPKKTILISPWLDLSMSNPEIKHFETKDCLLPVEGLVYAAKAYAGGEDLRHPLLSPIYGDLTNLGPILLFCGTNEVLYPDCQALVDMVSNAEGSAIDFQIGYNMMHDWIIFPFLESKEGINQIAQFMLSD
jgi:acetyl esterase/lipase